MMPVNAMSVCRRYPRRKGAIFANKLTCVDMSRLSALSLPAAAGKTCEVRRMPPVRRRRADAIGGAGVASSKWTDNGCHTAHAHAGLLLKMTVTDQCLDVTSDAFSYRCSSYNSWLKSHSIVRFRTMHQIIVVLFGAKFYVLYLPALLT